MPATPRIEALQYVSLRAKRSNPVSAEGTGLRCRHGPSKTGLDALLPRNDEAAGTWRERCSTGAALVLAGAVGLDCFVVVPGAGGRKLYAAWQLRTSRRRRWVGLFGNGEPAARRKRVNLRRDFGRCGQVRRFGKIRGHCFRLLRRARQSAKPMRAIFESRESSLI